MPSFLARRYAASSILGSPNEQDEPTLFAPIATVAAFRKGEEWRRQMLAYIEDNIRFVEDFCKANIPAVRSVRRLRS